MSSTFAKRRSGIEERIRSSIEALDQICSAPAPVVKTPGAMAFTRIPHRAHSKARDLVRDVTPAFAAPECAVPGLPLSVVADVTFRMTPPVAWSTRALHHEHDVRKTPWRLAESTACQPFGEIFSANCTNAPAALLTSIAGTPESPVDAATAASTCSESLTSQT